MKTTHYATRKIEIDAGHRIPRHNSKCKNLHGHRYVIEACFGAEELVKEGSETGMVKDFGFMKSIMTQEIHDHCDHALMLSIDDPLLGVLLPQFLTETESDTLISIEGVDTVGRYEQRLYITKFVPTAENLAYHWFQRIARKLGEEQPDVTLVKVRVYETPNCWADYFRN